MFCLRHCWLTSQNWHSTHALEEIELLLALNKFAHLSVSLVVWLSPHVQWEHTNNYVNRICKHQTIQIAHNSNLKCVAWNMVDCDMRWRWFSYNIYFYHNLFSSLFHCQASSVHWCCAAISINNFIVLIAFVTFKKIKNKKYVAFVSFTSKYAQFMATNQIILTQRNRRMDRIKIQIPKLQYHS